MHILFVFLLVNGGNYKLVQNGNATFSFVGSHLGLLNGHPTEYDAMNFFSNHTFNVNNVSVVFKEIKISENNVCHQGKGS